MDIWRASIRARKFAAARAAVVPLLFFFLPSSLGLAPPLLPALTVSPLRPPPGGTIPLPHHPSPLTIGRPVLLPRVSASCPRRRCLPQRRRPALRRRGAAGTPRPRGPARPHRPHRCAPGRGVRVRCADCRPKLASLPCTKTSLPLSLRALRWGLPFSYPVIPISRVKDV